ncbi:metal-dependent hydrolase (plasmid) [Halorarum halophilum]|uniref:Metal-dependent hydrolase n=1 Tax=Halorarum halophilum TaxID=2743090 RepID=A0A7D5KI69_9EURY|nr:metal-dependent hydrolase [Halobaculum halophilum]QLG29796.1 metal-dependent hydrolase [Halobaculum halophilum]
MWPWEHLAVGYLLYSLLAHLAGRTPRTLPVLALVLATQMPDLIDKPLAWGFGVLPSGRSMAHSFLFAAPAILGVSAAGLLARAPRVGPAFALGYLSHLGGDVLYPFVVKGELRFGFLLWPLIPAADEGPPEGLPHLQELVMDFVVFLLTPRGTAYLLFDGSLVLLAFLVWVWDGMPGVRPLFDAVRPGATPERE